MVMKGCSWIATVVAVAALLLLHVAHANLSPSYPEPGTVWTAGKEYEIIWEDDGTKPMMEKAWKNFRIDLMTGDNMNQLLVTNVASNLSAQNGVTSYKWKAPVVTPSAAVYFFTFTNENNDNAWTTRFAIVGHDGKLEKPEHSTQPSGEKIPWGVGKLVTSTEPKVTQVSVGPSAHVNRAPSSSSNSISSASTEAAHTAATSSVLTDSHIAAQKSSATFMSPSLWLSTAAIAWFIMTMRS